MRHKFLTYLDLFLAHLAGGKKGEPHRGAYLRTAVLNLLLATVLVVLLILDQWCLLQTSLGPDIPLLLATLLLAAGMVLCAIRSLQIAGKMASD